MRLGLIHSAAAMPSTLPIAASLLVLGAPLVGAGIDDAVERRLAVMGTGLTLAVEAPDRASALAASERAARAIEAAERRLSTWTAESELAALNRAALGSDVTLSPTLADELAAAWAWARTTGGAFDPTCGALVAARDLRGAGRVPTDEALAAAVARTGLDALEGLTEPPTAAGAASTTVVRRVRDVLVEEGAFGKGAGLDAALEALAADGDARAATLDLGGQWAWFGDVERTVELAHPDRRGEAAVRLSLDAATVSVATSGNSERARRVDGALVGHLLDPRSGRFARDFGSATVAVDASVAHPALAADALSTACFVLGPDAALELVAGIEGVELAVLEREGDALRVRHTPGLAGRVTALASHVQLAATHDAVPAPVEPERPDSLRFVPSPTGPPTPTAAASGAAL